MFEDETRQTYEPGWVTGLSSPPLNDWPPITLLPIDFKSWYKNLSTNLKNLQKTYLTKVVHKSDFGFQYI